MANVTDPPPLGAWRLMPGINWVPAVGFWGGVPWGTFVWGETEEGNGKWTKQKP